MPHKRKTVYAGKTIEIREYYTHTCRPPGMVRAKREKTTPEHQKVLNRMEAERKLRHLLNTNFHPGDWHVVLSYRQEERPATREELAKDKKAFFRAARSEYKKAGAELKYIYVAEVGKRGAMHHHIVMNADIDPKVLMRIWKKGRVHMNLLDHSGQYRLLAAYLIKYSDRMLGEDSALQGQRYIPSRNLKQPTVKVETLKRNRPKEPKVKPGYYLEKDSVREGISMVTGYPYREYTLIKLGGKDEETGG